MRDKSPLGWMLALLLLTGAGEARAQCTTADTPLRPIVATHTMPPYPEMSVMTKEQGRVLLDVSIGADGVPTDVQVAQTSGSLRLDEAARDYVKATWRWSPPLKNCMPAAVKTRVSILWNLRDAQPAAPGTTAVLPSMIVKTISIIPVDEDDYPSDLKSETATKMTLVMVVVGEGGASDAVIARPSGVPQLDAKAVALAKTRYRWTPARLNGKAVGGSYLLLMLWTPPGVKKPDLQVYKDMMDAYAKAAQARQPEAPEPPN